MRLHELHINNFKFFPKQDPKSPLLKIEGKNLLIYGENGSGKSTIYWALYTLLESAFKKRNNDVDKYFKRNGEFGLVNIFAPTNHNTYIKAILKEDGQPNKEYLISGNEADINAARSNSAIRESGMASDFLNYRIIFRLHHIKHSKDNNLFGWFEDEIFPYILIESISRFSSVEDNFKALKTGPKKVRDFDEINKMIFPNPAMREHLQEAVRKDYNVYKQYVRSVAKWNRKIEIYLKTITKRANELLSDDFKQNFQINLTFKGATHNVIPDDNGWKDPEITLSIPIYEKKRNVVKRAHSFLNEAKWSAIGLAIRFAIIEDWTNRPNTAELKALIIDDMLLSLDMSNRDIVLNLLIDRYINDYQLILMSHDRSFYEFAKRKIDIKGNSKNWIYLEMFEDNLSSLPQPYFKPVKTNLQTAKDYYNQHDYPACGIYLRKRIEELLKNLLPLKYLKEPSREDPNVLVDKILNDLIIALQPYCIAENIDFAELSEIKTYKDAILNPLAHNDIDAPYYRNELKMIIEILEKLEKIKRGKTVHHSNRNCNFILHKSTGEYFSVRMKTKEQIVLLEEDSLVPRISIFSKCKVSSTDNNGLIVAQEENFDTLREVYDEMCNRFGIPTKQDISREFDYDLKTFDDILLTMNL